MKKVSVILLSLISLDLAAATCDELNLMFSSRYKSDFNITAIKKDFECPSPSSTFTDALLTLDKLTFVPNNSGYTPNFYKYVKDRLKSLNYDPEYTKGEGKKNVIAYNRGGHVSVTERFLKADEADKVETLVHEARHSDESDTGHVVCKQGSMKDKKACDEALYISLNKGSGYNADTFFDTWVIQNSSYTTLSKKVVHTNLKYYLGNRFNNTTRKAVKYVWDIRDKKDLKKEVLDNPTYNISDWSYYAKFKELTGYKKILKVNVKIKSNDRFYAAVTYRVDGEEKVSDISVMVNTVPSKLRHVAAQGVAIKESQVKYVLDLFEDFKADGLTLTKYVKL